MTGEMVHIDSLTGETPDGEVYNLHAAIAHAVHGTIKPFDAYQGPYVAIGRDVRVGVPPYALAPRHLGCIRLWVSPDADFPDVLARVYRDDTDTLSDPFAAYGPGAEDSAVHAARCLLDDD